MKHIHFSLVKNFFRFSLLLAILMGGYGLHAQNWPSGPHDPSSMVKEGNKYWVFGTGPGVVSRYSTDMVTWSEGPTVFPEGEFPAWILNYAKTESAAFDGFFWAPDIIYMNNQYYLYYSCSVWGTRNSCVGLAINKTLDPSSPDFEWVDQGDIGIYSPDFSPGGSGWDVNAIDPAMVRGHDGKIWMAYGSFNLGGIMITQVDSVTGIPFGPKTSIANSWTGGTNYGEGEGAGMFYRDGYYYLVYNKGRCCNGIESTYYMVIGRSESPEGPYVDKEGKAMRSEGAASGGTIFFEHDDSRGDEDRYFGPGHFGLYREDGIDYVSFHYYNPNGYFNYEEGLKGGPTLGLGMLRWGKDGWPTFTMDFIHDGIYTLTNANSQKAMDVFNQRAVSYANLWQYPVDNNARTQKWIFRSLGTGEYTIQSYAEESKYIEVQGNVLSLASANTESINQRFRAVKGVDGKVIIYPSVKDELFEIPYAATDDAQIKTWVNTNNPCQRWELNLVERFNSIHQSTTDKINVFPNPTNGRVIIEIEDKATVNIYNSLGKQLISSEINTMNNELDISHFEPGLYIVEINMNNSRIQEMLIKR